MFACRLSLLLLASLQLVHGLQLTEKKINDVITLTLVHNGEDAMMSHAEAIDFCNNLAEKKQLYPVVRDANDDDHMKTTDTIVNAVAATSAPLITESMNATVSIEPLQTAGMRQSDLLSIHDPGMVAELMQWILNVERRQFWIGGMIRKVMQPFENHNQHIIHLWSDRTPTNFRFLNFPNEDLGKLAEGEVRCLSVDYASGKWGVHDCREKMYFVCATITPPTRMTMTDNDKAATMTTPIIKAAANIITKSTTKSISTKASTMKSTSKGTTATTHPTTTVKPKG